jgi:outer membrane lipoprotein-sorting protein
VDAVIRHHRRALPGASLLLSLLITLAAPVGAVAEPQDVLAGLLGRQQSISFAGERIRTTVRADSARTRITNRQFVRHRPPSDYRVDYLDLPEGRESHFMAQENRVFEWRDDERVLVSERSDDQTLGLVLAPAYLDLLRTNYRVVRTEGPPVAGRPTWDLQITGNQPGRPSIRAWIDREYGVPLRMERYDYRGELRLQTEYRDIRFGVELPDGVFELPDQAELRSTSLGRVYEGPEALYRRAGLPTPLLQRPPEGFRLDRIVHVQRRDTQYVQSFYSDGMATLSVFAGRPESAEPPLGGGERVRSVRSGVDGRDSWARAWIGEIRVTLISDDLSEAELVRAIPSVILARRLP